MDVQEQTIIARSCRLPGVSCFQPSQHLSGIINFGLAGVGILPEIEEFLVAAAGFGLHTVLLIDRPQPVIALGIGFAIIHPPERQTGDLFVLLLRLIRVSGLEVGLRQPIQEEGRLLVGIFCQRTHNLFEMIDRSSVFFFLKLDSSHEPQIEPGAFLFCQPFVNQTLELGCHFLGFGQVSRFGMNKTPGKNRFTLPIIGSRLDGRIPGRLAFRQGLIGLTCS
jgi:hypothetical protein